MNERLRRAVEREFFGILGYPAPPGAVEHALSALEDESAYNVAEAVRQTLIAALGCLQTVLQAAKNF